MAQGILSAVSYTHLDVYKRQILAFPVYPWAKKKLEAAGNGPKTAAGLVTAAGYIMLFLLTTAFLVNDTYNPFLYFRF